MVTVKGCIEGHNATFIIDSGSGITVMSSQVIVQIPSISSKGLVTCPFMTVRSVTGQDLKVIGKINTNLEICGHTINSTVYVAEDFHFDCLLVTDILSALGIVIDLVTKTISCCTYSEFTRKRPAFCQSFKFSLRAGNNLQEHKSRKI